MCTCSPIFPFFYQTTQCCIPQDHNQYTHRSENPKSHGIHVELQVTFLYHKNPVMNKNFAYFEQEGKALPNSNVSCLFLYPNVSTSPCWKCTNLRYSWGFKRCGNKFGVSTENVHAEVLKIFQCFEKSMSFFKNYYLCRQA
jgi:hypothetical protein